MKLNNLVRWQIFVPCMAVAAIVAYGASRLFGFSFWIAFGITVGIWLALGLLTLFDD